jgi:hypothetical protein
MTRFVRSFVACALLAGFAVGCSSEPSRPEKVPEMPKGGPVGVGTGGKNEGGATAPPPPPSPDS